MTIQKDLKLKKCSYHPQFHHKFQRTFKKFNIILAPVNVVSITNIQGFSNSDVYKSGVYQMTCVECDKIYTGQTKQNVSIRWKEYF